MHANFSQLAPLDPERFLVMVFATGPTILLFFWTMDLIARKESIKLALMAAAAMAVLHYTDGFRLAGF